MGFPIARVGAIKSLAWGAIVNLGFCRHAGKGQGEVSSLSEQTIKEDLALWYRARGNSEIDLRSNKITMQMDELRRKSPELVRKEAWTHILVDLLTHTIMAQSATRHHIEPRTISFKGSLQTLEAFQLVIALQGQHDSKWRLHLYQQLLAAIAMQRMHRATCCDRP